GSSLHASTLTKIRARVARVAHSSRAVAKLSRHLDHGSTEAYAAKESLCGLVPLGRREHDLGRTSSVKLRKRCLEQHSANAVAAMRGIDDDVVQHACRPAQRHVVAPLDTRVGVSE